jgi:phenylacetate-CoA ligase
MPPEATITPPTTDPHVEASVLDAYARVVATMPWYRTLLAEQGVAPETVRDIDGFRRHCPILTKQNTFERFPIAALAATTPVPSLAAVLTSSGHGGRFSFGLTTRAQEQSAAEDIDAALDAAFGVRARPTLAINCLPMGVTFASRCMTVATTSVREDMAVALVETFGSAYEQVLLVADPLFLKRLTDHARQRGLDWSRYRLQVVVGEEVFGEHFRAYMSTRLGLGRPSQPDTFLMSSFGVGELGLHLCHETRATVALRRLACHHPTFARALLGPSASTSGVPMIFTYLPSRTFMEIDAADADGYGRLTVSMLDPSLPIPLLRYQPGDIARRLDVSDVHALLEAHGLELPEDLPAPLIALRGRAREVLPNGATVSLYKDALYADPLVAEGLTGAMRLVFEGTEAIMHVQQTPAEQTPAEQTTARQLAESAAARDVAARLAAAIPCGARPRDVVVWPYDRFPFGMTLDYERKFVGYPSS